MYFYPEVVTSSYLQLDFYGRPLHLLAHDSFHLTLSAAVAVTTAVKQLLYDLLLLLSIHYDLLSSLRSSQVSELASSLSLRIPAGANGIEYRGKSTSTTASSQTSTTLKELHLEVGSARKRK